MATTSIQINIEVQDAKTVGLGSYKGTPAVNYAPAQTTVTKVYSVSGSASTAQTYDVTSGLTDAYGTALVFTSVKTVVVNNTHATASLVIGGGSNPLFGTDQYTVKPLSCLPITSPFTVDGTHKVITVTPSATCTYQLLVTGT